MRGITHVVICIIVIWTSWTFIGLVVGPQNYFLKVKGHSSITLHHSIPLIPDSPLGVYPFTGMEHWIGILGPQPFPAFQELNLSSTLTPD